MTITDYLVVWGVTTKDGDLKLFTDRLDAWRFASWAEGAGIPRKLGLVVLPEEPTT